MTWAVASKPSTSFDEPYTKTWSTPDRRRAVILADTVEAALDLGELAIADRALEEAERIVTEIGDGLGLAHISFLRARACAVRGDGDLAAKTFAGARTLLAGHEDPSTLRWVRLIEAELAGRRGDPMAAERLVLAVLDEADRDEDAIGVVQARHVQRLLVESGLIAGR